MCSHLKIRKINQLGLSGIQEVVQIENEYLICDTQRFSQHKCYYYLHYSCKTQLSKGYYLILFYPSYRLSNRRGIQLKLQYIQDIRMPVIQTLDELRSWRKIFSSLYDMQCTVQCQNQPANGGGATPSTRPGVVRDYRTNKTR